MVDFGLFGGDSEDDYYAASEEDYYRDNDDSGGGGWTDWIPTIDYNEPDPADDFQTPSQGGSAGVGFLDSIFNFATGVDNAAYQRDVLNAKRERHLLDITTPKEVDVEPFFTSEQTGNALLIGGAVVAGLVGFSVLKKVA